MELIQVGANELVGADQEKIMAAVQRNLGRVVRDEERLYGGGQAAGRVVEQLSQMMAAA